MVQMHKDNQIVNLLGNELENVEEEK
jgi:hypothetical protein